MEKEEKVNGDGRGNSQKTCSRQCQSDSWNQKNTKVENVFKKTKKPNRFTTLLCFVLLVELLKYYCINCALHTNRSICVLVAEARDFHF